MNKIKKWIKIKLRKFLEIDTLEYYVYENEKSINKHMLGQNIKNELDHKQINRSINTLHTNISHFQDSVNVLHNTVENVVHIGTNVDINKYNHSWCVICIEGKINIVKFIDLDRGNVMEILSFLKRFEAGKHCIDTPYKEMFFEGMFKF